MDNLTHGLLGAAVGMLRARDGGPENGEPLTDTDKAAVWAAFIASELPDIDVFFTGSDPMAYLDIHRGLTHGLVLAPVGAALAAGITKLLWRQARYGTLFLWSLAALVGVHLLPDWLTGWGTLLLAPFSQVKAALDWVPIVDWVVIVALIPALMVAWRRPHLRRRLAAGALIGTALWWVGYRGVAHQLVQARVTARYAGQQTARINVAPDLFNPLRWRYTVDLGTAFEQGSGFPWGLTPAIQSTAKPAEDEVTRAIRAAPEVGAFFRHFKFPLITYARTEQGYQVQLVDIRYSMVSRGMFYYVLLDPNLKVTAISDRGF